MKPYLYLLLFLLIACGKDCANNSQYEALNNLHYSNGKYQRELIFLIGDSKDNAYFFDRRETHEQNTYLILDCYGDGFCGKLMVWVQNEDLQSRKLQNNSGYQNAELKGLEIAHFSQKNPTREEVMIYQGLEGIID